MNKAQKHIKKLLEVAEGELEIEYLNACYDAWEGYEDSQYSYPFWQLRKLEKQYGCTTTEIKHMYNVKY